MDVTRFVESGWAGFWAVILAVAGLIASIALGRGNRRRIDENRETFQFGVSDFLFWPVLASGLAHSLFRPFLRTLPVAIVVPGVDLALFGASVVLLMVGLWRASTSLDWDWRMGLGQFIWFVIPGLAGILVLEDLKVYPAGWWFFAGVEAALLLPFLVRVGLLAKE